MATLCETAMLVKLGTSRWMGAKTSKAVSHEVCVQKDADDDAGDWKTYLIPKEALKDINNARSRARSAWLQHSLPWQDGGFRILPSALFMTWRKEMRKVMDDFDAAVAAFLIKYPEYVAAADERLGKLGEECQLPSVDEIKGKFGIYLDVLPMPNDADFRMAIDEEEMEEIRSQAKTTIKNSLDKAMKELVKQFGEIVKKISTTLKDTDKKFKDSLIGNLRTFCETTLPQFNLTNDPVIETLRKEALATLACFDPEDLRVIDKERETAGKKADDLLKKINDYM